MRNEKNEKNEPDSDELAGYRPVSPLAVAALACGASAVLVLVTPLAAMLPLIAVMLAVVALVDLRRSEGKRAGRPLALAGLALALGFAAQAAAAGFVHGWIARQRAGVAAEAWIDAVRDGRMADALAMCGPGGFSLPADVAAAPEPPTPAVREEAFRSVPAVQAVSACGTVRPEVIRVDRRTGAGDDDAWKVSADLSACGGPGGTLRIDVAARSETGQRGTVERWLVVGLDVDR